MQKILERRMWEVEFDGQRLLRLYLRKWWMILICFVLGAAIAFGVTYQFVTPLYQARISIYVNNNKSIEDKDYLSSADLAASQRLVNTYISIAKSERVLGKIAEKLDGAYDTRWLNRAISAEQLNSTEMFCIYVLHEDPVEAARIANAAAEVAPAEIAQLVEGTSARVLDEASVPTSCYSPNYGRTASFGGVVGVLLAVIFLTLRFMSDTRIKDENDLTELSALPVLGRIPNFDAAPSESGYGYSK